MAFQNDYEKTGLLAVDTVATAVSHYRRWKKPLKTVYLSPKQYVQFHDWVKFNLDKQNKDIDEVERIEFDGVEVKMNSSLMGEKVYFDFYEDKPAIEA